jgi:DNA-binding XRE family transcriptional regulator
MRTRLLEFNDEPRACKANVLLTLFLLVCNQLDLFLDRQEIAGLLGYDEDDMPSRGRKPSEKFIHGEEVKAWRMSRGISQKTLGAWLGLTSTAIAKYENRGATKGIALALAAIDRGIKPYRATKDDLASVDK